MFRWLGRWWRKRLRKIDKRWLWPQCVIRAAETGGNLEDAHLAFMMHAAGDSNWTTDYSLQEIADIVFNWKSD